MLVFDHVSKRYPNGYDALSDVSFTVEAGAFVFLTGPSGAGKSTLLKMINGVERSSRGQVHVAGQNISRLPARKIPGLRQGIGVVFQNHQLLFDRRVYDNVALPLFIAGMKPAEIGRRVRAALSKVGLTGREGDWPETLSGGEQQRVGIARAVVHRPPILLADEPTGNLDPDLSREIMSLFLQFSQLGVTVLIATHDLELVESMPARRLQLQDGRIRAE
ncbi:MAG TPA: cell division ATP-binding protein FtsE [Gammaproteobacteria bacterium]|jgi:cell division transport system ATP-binding protein|nr:cell division ATP-binding protein FtsE [Gammaproteobacteria bacterium]MDA0825411.1 cell division ATP-binding protein FtsE [Pseudomonadota bacterium]MDA8626982.1 cell division ATP-binding protein FtsE [Pseudomonadales bacterium]MBT5463528.1 cell division ATP-binding protein FtsE [Gammaproteobacteria bacterium]MBT6793795.1 cell division ATP-binding protein FtsE [Gammaproteobacteria bacterium]|tara:strand:- start:1147 stop:1803 length:657 start_codon:yes stop_codon:yes gene_type:complete